MEQFLSFCALLGLPSIVGVITICIKYYKDAHMIKSALQNLLRADLIKDGKRYLELNDISDIEYIDWKSRYECYHALGVNGVLDELNKKVIDLAVTEI